jgi:hypothetical protein
MFKEPSLDPIGSHGFDPQDLDNHAVDSLASGGAIEYVFVSF